MGMGGGQNRPSRLPRLERGIAALQQRRGRAGRYLGAARYLSTARACSIGAVAVLRLVQLGSAARVLVYRDPPSLDLWVRIGFLAFLGRSRSLGFIPVVPTPRYDQNFATNGRSRPTSNLSWNQPACRSYKALIKEHILRNKASDQVRLSLPESPLVPFVVAWSTPIM